MVKLLIWLILHGAHPSNDTLLHRHVAPHPKCSRCMAPSDSILHCLRDCNRSRDVWGSVSLSLWSNFFNLDTIAWVSAGAGFFGVVNHFQATQFCCILWWIWHARNYEIFSNKHIKSTQVLSQANIMAMESTRLLSKLEVSQTHIRRVQWESPKLGYKLNVDGSSLGNTGHVAWEV
ncbi:hypothetical protein L6164_013342 [Bauhinia variegata]|uniref:Uncharacterized protein n=1 Tax=Bauhinia variegata TaxID=167791 RepID=A0ACB9PFK8_BAUVA|nr:hypothetical protein L6164_013342 [Bauhinia variegata]